MCHAESVFPYFPLRVPVEAQLQKVEKIVQVHLPVAVGIGVFTRLG
jgi:hypothetical protein